MDDFAAPPQIQELGLVLVPGLVRFDQKLKKLQVQMVEQIQVTRRTLMG